MESTPPPVLPVPLTTPPPLPPPPTFRLHLAAWILWGVASVVIIGTAALKTSGLDPDAAAHVWGERVGFSVGMLLFPILISWCVWRFTRPSRMAANVTFFVIYGLAVAGQLLPLVNGKLTGITDAVALQEAGKKYVADVNAAKDRYQAAGLKADSNHVLDFKWLTDQASIAPRRTALKELVAVNQEFRQVVANGEKNYRAALAAKGVSAQSIESAVAGFDKAQVAKLPLMLKIRDTDDAMFAAVLTLVDLLDSEWGHWSRRNGQIAFERNTALTKFNAAIAEVQAAAKEQAAAQKQLGLDVQ